MPAEKKHDEMPDALSAIIAFWSQWMEQSAKGTQAILELVATTSDPATMQRKWLDILSEEIDGFMRTPAFMEMMRRNLKAVTDMKLAQDQVVHGTARQFGMPLADDVAGLFERLRSTEQETVARLEAIEQRLDSLVPTEAHSNGATTRKPAARGRASKSTK